jgi:lysophospholipase L1-like esterase
LFIGDSYSLGGINDPATGFQRKSAKGTISTTTMTFSQLNYPTAWAVNDPVYGVGVSAGTIASSGSGLNWTVNNSQSVSSTNLDTGEPTLYGDGIARIIADLLGARAVVNAIGGTGYNTPISGGNTSIPVRTLTGGDIAALYAAGLVDGIVILAGINDAGAVNGGSQTRSAVQTATNNYYFNLASWLVSNAPLLPVVVGGNFYNSSFVGAGTNPTGANPNMEADIFAAVAAAKVASPSVRLATFQVNNTINGSGNMSNHTGDGNADTYMNADYTHLNYLGFPFVANLLAPRIYSAFQSI